MPVSHLKCGKPKVGSIHRIHVDGLNGIADIIWVVEHMMMNGKSRGGMLCGGILRKSKITVAPEIFSADLGNGKRYSTGHMTPENNVQMIYCSA